MGQPTNNNNNNNNQFNWSNVATAGAGGVLGMIGNVLGNQNAYNQQQNLMNLQFQNQQALNQQAHELGKDMWDYTNYENQTEHMRKAGLNIGLMYGGGGGGGSTTSQPSGGGASGGSAPMPINVMEMMNQMQMTKANIELAQANAEKARAEAEKLKGVDTQEAQSRINLNSIRTRFETESLPTALEQTKAELENTLADTRKKVAEGTITEIDAKTENWKNVSNVLNTIMSTKQMSESIKQKWKEVSIAKQNADANTKNADTNYKNYLQNIQNTKIKEFEADLKSEYPSIGNTIGKMLNDIMHIGMPEGNEDLHKKVKDHGKDW